ncbi:MAG: SsrA-binding protein SmpB [Minisyncoccales bacterium]
MKIIAKNKKALFDYEIMEKMEAGLALEGSEIKSIRDHNVNLKGSFVILRNMEAFVKGMHISPYKFMSYNIDPERERKLLLKKREIEKIDRKIKEPGVTCVPLAIGISPRGFAKLEIALVKGKKQFDKRESLKRKTTDREMQRKIKSF